MAFLKFTDALMEAKRRASLQGRQVTQQEATGISEGIAEAAGERGIQAQSLAQQKEQFDKQYGLQEQQYGLQIRSLEQQISESNRQYALAQQQLAEQIRQFNESSETQKAQFGEQMAFQIYQTGEQVKYWKDQSNTTKTVAAMQLTQAGMPIPATFAPEGWTAQSYLENNPDIAADAGWAAQPLRHWYEHGAGENRKY
jgi:hypothetical protein